MTEADRDVTAESSPTGEMEGDPGNDDDTWRDGVAFITPIGAREWLALPITDFTLGAGVAVTLLLISHGRGLTLQDWVLFSGACILALCAFPLAVAGRRAWSHYELAVSQDFIRWQLGLGCFLGVLASVVGITADAFPVALAGLALIWILRLRRDATSSRRNASDFHRALAAVVQRAFLIEGIALVVASVTCALVGTLLLGAGSELEARYIGSGFVFVLVGALMTVMALQEARARNRAIRQATTEDIR